MSLCRGMSSCQHCSNCCAVLSTTPGRGHYSDHYLHFIHGGSEVCPRKSSQQRQSWTSNAGSRLLATLLSCLLRKSAAHSKVTCKYLYGIQSLSDIVCSVENDIPWPSSDILNCKRRKNPRHLVQIGIQDSEVGVASSVKGPVSGNAEANLLVPWPEGSVVMGRRIKGQNCCPRQKYCNRNHLTGLGSKSLPSSSHFSSGQSL